MAASVFLLAKHTGWTLAMILWELPLVLLHQAEHVYLWQDGAKLRRPGRMDSQDRRDIQRILGI